MSPKDAVDEQAEQAELAVAADLPPDAGGPGSGAADAPPDASAPAEAEGAAFARLYGEPVLKLPNDLYIPPDALEVILEAFEGPLDLLLYLIRKQNFNILDIPMAQVTLQYLKYVDQIRRTIAALGSLDTDALAPETRAGLIEAFRGWRRR